MHDVWNKGTIAHMKVLQIIKGRVTIYTKFLRVISRVIVFDQLTLILVICVGTGIQGTLKK